MNDYVFKKGRAARKYLDEQKGSKVTYLKSGDDALMVKVAGPEDYVLFFEHGFFGGFKSTLCHDAAGHGADLYCKAHKVLLAEHNQKRDKLKEEGKSKEDIKKLLEDEWKAAYSLKAKANYLMAFIDLDTGEPIIVKATEKQGNGVIDVIEKNHSKNRLDKLAFELYKTGEGSGTTIKLDAVIDMEEDLTDKQRENFEKAKGMEIPESAFANIFSFRDEDKQIEDLQFIGFDLSKIGVEEPDEVEPIEDDEPEKDF
jgi:hypothetical protein